MPQTRSSRSAPPPVMTWSKAGPVLALALLFDAIRVFFQFFWFFGPALAVGYCQVGVDGAVASAACSATATTVGYFGAPIFMYLGSIGAIIAAIAGWMIVGLIVVSTNFRILYVNARTLLHYVMGLGVGLMPFVGSLPALSVTVGYQYRLQIAHDKEKYAAWQQQNAAQIARERDEWYAKVARARALAEQADEEAVLEEEIPEDVEYAT
jgi:hypothetical protein